MGKWVVLGKAEELAEGTMKKYAAEGQEVLVVHANKAYYAVQNRCPHMGGNLSAGQLDGTVVTCPRHGSRFNVADGSVVQWLKGSGIMVKLAKMLKPEEKLQTYPVKVENGELMASL